MPQEHTYHCCLCPNEWTVTLTDDYIAARAELGLPLVPKADVWCKECLAKADAAQRAAIDKDSRARRVLAWPKICPDKFLDSKINRLPRQNISEIALLWKYQEKGLILKGPPERGKTRTVWLLLQRLYVEEGKTIAGFDAQQWARECGKKCEDRRIFAWIESLRSLDILFIDDIDKMNVSARVQAELFSIVKTRIENNKPMLFTTNMTSEELEEKFGKLEPTQGAAFVSRILAHCTPVLF